MNKGPDNLHPKIDRKDLGRSEQGFLLTKAEDDELRKFLRENPDFRGKLPKKSKTHPDSPFRYPIIISNKPGTNERVASVAYQILGKGGYGRVYLSQDVTDPTSTKWTVLKRQNPDPKERRYNTLVNAIKRENVILQETNKLRSELVRSKTNKQGEKRQVFYSHIELAFGGELGNVMFDDNAKKIPKYDVFAEDISEQELQKRMLSLITFARETMREVQFLHNFNIVNRDIKPPNIMLDETTLSARNIDQGLAMDAGTLASLVKECAEVNAAFTAAADTLYEAGLKASNVTDETRDENEDYYQKGIEALEEKVKLKKPLTAEEKNALNFNKLNERREELANLICSGTPMYTAPEVYVNQQCDFRSDIYSLGVTVSQIFHPNFFSMSLYEDEELEGSPQQEQQQEKPQQQEQSQQQVNPQKQEITPEQVKAKIMEAGMDEVMFSYLFHGLISIPDRLKPFEPLFDAIMLMVHHERDKRPSIAQTMDLYYEHHLKLLQSLGLNAQEKLVRQEYNLVKIQTDLQTQFRNVSTPLSKENLKLQIMEIEEFRRQIHAVSSKNPMPIQDLILLGDKIIEMHILQEAKPANQKLPSEFKDVLIALENHVTLYLQEAQKMEVAEKPLLSEQEKSHLKETGSPMFKRFKQSAEARTEINPDLNKPPELGEISPNKVQPRRK